MGELNNPSAPQTVSGNYAGNNAGTRTFTGFGYNPLAVFINARNAASTQGTVGFSVSATAGIWAALTAGIITTVTTLKVITDGFSVNSDMNLTGITYDYILIKPG